MIDSEGIWVGTDRVSVISPILITKVYPPEGYDILTDNYSLTSKKKRREEGLTSFEDDKKVAPLELTLWT